MIDAATEFQRHAKNCAKMARASDSPNTKVEWKQLAERWLVCAKLMEDGEAARRARDPQSTLRHDPEALTSTHARFSDRAGPAEHVRQGRPPC